MKKVFLISIGLMAALSMLAACAPGAIPTAPITIAPSTVKPDTQPEVQPQVSTTATIPNRIISVTGSGQVFLVPDVAYVYIGVHSQSDNV
ncbi:MAG TPA: SIMPL domain-containing protein, partial [Leptolinea sp.]